MVQLLYRHGFWVQCGRGFDGILMNLKFSTLNKNNPLCARKVIYGCRGINLIYLPTGTNTGFFTTELYILRSVR